MIEKKDLILIRGGATFSATLLNAISRIVGLLFDLGRSIGSTFRRIKEHQPCKLS